MKIIYFLLAFFLLIILTGSITMNFFLFQKVLDFYKKLNKSRLDPYGLNSFSDFAVLQLKDSENKRKVVLFGDSRAASWHIPEISNDQIVINRGINGQTSEQVLGRFDDHIKPLHPKIIIVQVGINELKTIPFFPQEKQLLIAKCKTNIHKIVQKSTDLGTTVILTTIFPPGEVPFQRIFFRTGDIFKAVEDVNKYLFTLANKNVYVFDTYTILADEKGKLKKQFRKDLFHINNQGYEALNEELMKLSPFLFE